MSFGIESANYNQELKGNVDLFHEISMYELCRIVTIARAANSIDGTPSLEGCMCVVSVLIMPFAFIGILYKV